MIGETDPLKKGVLIFIIRNSKRFASAALVLAIFLMVIHLGIGQISNTVYAEEYDAAMQAEEEPVSGQEATYANVGVGENAPYGIYEMMTENQRNTYIRIQQFRQKQQQWKQNQLPYTAPRDFEAEAAAAKEAAVKQVEEARTRVVLERARYEEEVRNTWHNPLVVDTYVTSYFGYRWHPVYGTYRMHNGVDLDSNYGDLVRASRGGVVCDAGWNQYYGYYVIIDHGDGFKTEYFHLWDYYVYEGDTVKYCQPIGEVGSTGVSTGPHLHFGMLYENEYVDPEDYIDFRN